MAMIAAVATRNFRRNGKTFEEGAKLDLSPCAFEDLRAVGLVRRAPKARAAAARAATS